ncbi:MAG: transposase [Pirellulales bacterium]
MLRVEGCDAADLVRQINHGLAAPRRTFTHAFARYALELSGRMNEKLTAPAAAVVSRGDGEAEESAQRLAVAAAQTPDNLDASRDEVGRLYAALRLNESLATAYYLKEELRQIWEQPDKRHARRALRSWYQQAKASGIRVLIEMANTLAAHEYGILAWYDYPISTGPLEGTNNKTKTIKRQHYGLRDQEFFTLKLYALHETRYALVG